MLVAVYGTLKRGMSNHMLLDGAPYLGADTLKFITLYDLGEYPAALLEPSDGVMVEVFKVSSTQIDALDRFEECDVLNSDAGLYKRCSCQTHYGDAWIYIYNRPVNRVRRLDSGSWCPSLLPK
ncbi:MAG: gamma-glutamylcyclotransferase family protein [Gammaproteobacteria bacterium]|nr:gamma-glutamylcyclotransferase family protein [Gammaproteobacteria bacterium]MDP2140914.1 gamma-glutamylcyclotransferase family protein [Gammaproteobacteria bacterium]MDP2349342.1 gamma-glutamylcyclotransferase family protein [Gammaproteobacteria bacterium]